MERQREREKRRQIEWEKTNRDLVSDASSTNTLIPSIPSPIPSVTTSYIGAGPVSSQKSVAQSYRGSLHATLGPAFSRESGAPRQVSNLSAGPVESHGSVGGRGSPDHGPATSSHPAVCPVGSAVASLIQSSQLSTGARGSPGQSSQTVPGLVDVVDDILGESSRATGGPSAETGQELRICGSMMTAGTEDSMESIEDTSD